MSDTPRTDEFYDKRFSYPASWEEKHKDACDFARQLERELNAAKTIITQIYNDTEGYADGAPDASSHDKLCNEISSICKPFVTTP